MSNLEVSPRLIDVSTVDSIYKPKTVKIHRLDFEEAVKFFTTFTPTEKKEAVAAYSGAVYGEELYRKDTNVVAMSLAVIDFDNEVKDEHGQGHCTKNPARPEDLESSLHGITYFYHSTHSNTTDWPKWRLIIPLNSHAGLDVWGQVTTGILHLLGGGIDGIDMSCFELSRAFFVPSFSEESTDAAFSGYSKGQEVIHVC